MNKIRCAIYTRKSSEEGLEQEFNSLDAQREACEAYIVSQKHEGWVLLKDHFDDGGLSGGNMDRPALQRLLQAVDDGLVDQIIVYKVDRLTRSLPDFSRLIERLDKAKASFVSVTQSFNTATSMGRLTLNVLLSFAQFEREVTAERIRDKIAASKKKGMWMGGPVPLGYNTKDRMLVVREDEAKTVRQIYDLYIQHGTVRATKFEADRLGLLSRRWTTKSGADRGGLPYTRGHLYRILTNPIYVGMVHHKGSTYEGQHEGIIDPEVWQKVQSMLTVGKPEHRDLIEVVNQQTNAASEGTHNPSLPAIEHEDVPAAVSLVPSPASPKRAYRTEPSVLVGKVFDEMGDRLTPSHANKKGRRYRYYISNRLITRSGEKQSNSLDGDDGQSETKAMGGWRLPAQVLEDAVTNTVTEWLKQTTFVSKLVPDLIADEQLRIGSQTEALLKRLSMSDQTIINIVPFIERIDLQPGQITVHLDREQIAQQFDFDPERLAPEALHITASFNQRKRGVETKLVVGKSPQQLDPMLIRNLAQARAWYSDLKSGASLSSIAHANNTTVALVTRILPMAFLSPAIVEAICTGTQPPEITSRKLRDIDIPSKWTDQERLFELS